MTLTKEVVDTICPLHDRTSCTDEDLSNSFSKNDKEGIIYPRCVRCYLLDNIDKDVNDLDFNLNISLEHKDHLLPYM